MAIVRRAVTVTGLVQGVSFRYYAEREAARLGLSGWVRNHDDGTVRLEVQGPEQDVDELVDWLHHGPPAARVGDVLVDDIDPRDGDEGFRTVR